MRLSIFAIAAIAIAPAMANAQPREAAPATAPATEATEATDPDQQIVCRREKPTGSNFYRKVCATKAEWKALGVQRALGEGMGTNRSNYINP